MIAQDRARICVFPHSSNCAVCQIGGVGAVPHSLFDNGRCSVPSGGYFSVFLSLPNYSCSIWLVVAGVWSTTDQTHNVRTATTVTETISPCVSSYGSVFYLGVVSSMRWQSRWHCCRAYVPKWWEQATIALTPADFTLLAFQRATTAAVAASSRPRSSLVLAALPFFFWHCWAVELLLMPLKDFRTDIIRYLHPARKTRRRLIDSIYLTQRNSHLAQE